MLRVILIEDDPDVREMLSLIINDTEGFSCLRSFANCESALPLIEKETPDVVLMDIDLPGMSGIEGVRRLKGTLPHLDIIMLTVQEDDDSVFNSLCAGASGYLLKSTSPARILKSISEVANGGAPMSSSVARKVVTSFKPQSPSPLSPRETEVLRMLCEGQNYKAVSEALFISGHTVRMHIKNIYKKLHVHSRGEAVKKAVHNRFI